MEIFHQHILMVISLTVMRQYWRFIWTEARVANAIVRKRCFIFYAALFYPSDVRGLLREYDLPESGHLFHYHQVYPTTFLSIEDTLVNIKTTIIEPQELTIHWLLVHQIYLSLIHLELLWIQQSTRLDSSHPSFHPPKILSSLIKPLRSYIQKS